MNYSEKEIEIRFVQNWPKEDIVALYKAGGWWKNCYDSAGIDELINGSFAFAIAIDKQSNKAIGMGRIISDGVSDAYFQDIVILPEYRKKGIGKKLVKKLVDHCLSKGIQWIGLIAEPDQDSFYHLIGFKQMRQYVPMKYEQGE